MTAQLAPRSFITVDEYLEGEQLSDIRHEYGGGMVEAMAGATEAHELVMGNIFAALHNHLRGKGCRVFTGNHKLKIQLNHADLVYYPDTMVVCDPADTEPLFKTSPKVLVEVMSDYNKDHVEKLFAYQQIASLEDYLVLNQDFADQKAWIYRRATGWSQELIAPGGMIELPSVGFSIPLAELYAL